VGERANAVALVAVFGLLGVTTPAGPSINSVTVIPSPNPGVQNNLVSVSCVNTSWCIGAGNYSPTIEQGGQTLIVAIGEAADPTTTVTTTPSAEPVVPVSLADHLADRDIFERSRPFDRALSVPAAWSFLGNRACVGDFLISPSDATG